MNIQLNKPYKIHPAKHKRYDVHYSICSAEALIVPRRDFGDESISEVRWEDDNGELHFASSMVFSNANLIRINAATDVRLIELWDHYYAPEGHVQ